MSDTWIDIDLDVIVSNYQEVVSRLRPGSQCMAVVKADAYGLGAVQVSLALAEAGCTAFAVTTVKEGLHLRKYGINGDILVLGPVSTEDVKDAILQNLQLTVSDFEMLELLEQFGSELSLAVNTHIKLETGMGRTGFLSQDLDKLTVCLRESSYIKPVGIYTHFARAAQRDKAYNSIQYERFNNGVEKLEASGISIPFKHVCNSAAFLDYPEWHLDLVRIGTLLIGHYPGPGFKRELKLRDPWVAKTKLVQIRDVPSGTYVGYQSTYKTKNATRLGVIPVGYSDGIGVEPHLTPQGFFDLLKIMLKNTALLFGVQLGREKMQINGQPVRLAGKIGMQLTVLDLGRVACQRGDEVIIPLRRTTANPRIVRRYWREGRIFSIRSIQEGFLPLHPECSN